MRGESVSLREIVLSEVQQSPPEPIDLICHEQIEASEEEEEEPEPYKIVILCPFCEKPLRLWCLANQENIRVLHELLLDSLGFVCGSCGRRRHYDG
uniref:Protein E7 n=1 Tax=Bat papillomavirus TaxID=2004707 RepID=A0A2Z2JN83_9PAPI|nr:E7 [Bat papillomavirus]